MSGRTRYRAKRELDDGSELTYTFDVVSEDQYHPYGSTYAVETLSEIDDDSEELELDGEEVERDELEARLGMSAAELEEMLESMRDSAPEVHTWDHWD